MAQQGRHSHHEDNNGESYIFNPMSYNYHQHHAFSPPAVLSQQDANVMADFFNNPDTTSTADSFLGYTVEDHAASIQQHALTAGGATNNSLGDSSHANYNGHMPQNPREAFSFQDLSAAFMQNSNSNTHSAGDAVAGASALLGLSTSQEQAQLLGANSYMGWNTYVGSHLQAPSNTSSTTTGLIPARAAPLRSSSTSQMQAQMSSPIMPHANSWADITQHTIDQRARHNSLNIDTSMHLPMHENTWQREPMSAMPHVGRPPLARFGSDSRFSEQGFAGQQDTPTEEEQAAFRFTGRARQDATPTQGLTGFMHRHSIAGLPEGGASSTAAMFAGLTAAQHAASYHPGMGTPVLSSESRKRSYAQMNNDSTSSSAPAQINAQPQPPAANPVTNGHAAINAPARTANAQAVVQVSSAPAQAQAAPSAPPAAPAQVPAPATATAPRRRGPQRPPRTNLSEQQKRANHIASEQKRRDNMKTNFDLLGRRVAAVKDGGAMSRSEVLYHISNHIEATAIGNRMMCQIAGVTLEQLDAMSESEDDSEDDDD